MKSSKRARELSAAMNFQEVLREHDGEHFNTLVNSHNDIESSYRISRLRVRSLVCEKQGGHWWGTGVTTDQPVGFCIACGIHKDSTAVEGK